MKKKIILLAMTCLAIMTTSFGQIDTSIWDLDPVPQIFEIRKVWADHPIRVENLDPKARIKSFANAFCEMYQEYKPNEVMIDYLKNPDLYTYEEKKYYRTEYDPRNGYVMCDMGWQYDYMTEMCYWRRPNGHQLVGVLMQVGHEGEHCDAVLLFYDFDPKTQLMSPDMAIYQSVMDIVSKHYGQLYVTLPHEDKDIEMFTVHWTEIDDFVYDSFLLKWTGNSFVEVEIEPEEQ